LLKNLQKTAEDYFFLTHPVEATQLIIFTLPFHCTGMTQKQQKIDT